MAKTLDLLLYKLYGSMFLGMIWVTTSDSMKTKKVRKELIFLDYQDDDLVYK